MEKFLKALVDYDVHYTFPQIWKTKGETLKEYMTNCKDDSSGWIATRSCWQGNRQVSVDHHTRQCGICAACILRRMSVYSAGLKEPGTNYVWENLALPSFEKSAASGFDKRKITSAMREYAIAGTLHHAHLAGLSNSVENEPMLRLRASQLSKELKQPINEVQEKLNRLLKQHGKEWEEYMNSLGSNSFVTLWSKQVLS
jgi:hypothetical protein